MTLELVAPVESKDEVTAYLQRKGAVELSVPEETEGFSCSDVSKETTQAERQRTLFLDAQAILKRAFPEKKPLTAMLEPRKEISPEDYAVREKSLGDIELCCRKVIELDRKKSELKADNVRLQTLIDQLSPWKECDIPVRPGFTKKTACIPGSIRERRTGEDVLELLAKQLPDIDCVEVDIVSSSELGTCMAVFCMKEDVEEVENVLRADGFMRAPDCGDREPARIIGDYLRQIKENEKQLLLCEEELATFRNMTDDLEFAADAAGIRKDRLSVFDRIPESSRVFYIRGYIAKRDAEKISRYCTEHFDAAVEISEPGEDEDVPVLLTNNAFAAPLENITGMYSMPSNADIDPTGIMAFFYYFFFGMMLSDAGYGLLMTLATGGILLLKRNLEPKMKNTMKMYCFCGISTVFWGAMYGSWFGDAGAVICREFFGKDINPLPPIWTDAVNDLMNVLIVCFICGLVHLFVGVLLKGITDWKNGKKFDAFCDTVPTYLTILGIAPIFFNLFLQDTMPENYTALGTFIFNLVKSVHAGLSVVSTPMLIVGLVLVVATGGRSSKSIGGKIGGGLYEVYNLIGGYLGDVLSYARLLALGLATGVIAQVMNMLGTLPKSQPLKTIMFIVVFIVGHIANLAINVIGAYVHTNRLQYVEFFGKFYDGGGRAFVPLAADTQYYKFKEEN